MLRDVTNLYNRNLISIVILNLVLVIPVTFFIYCAISYFSILDTVEFSNLMTAFFIIVNFTVLFPPFLFLAKNDLNETTFRYFELLKVFFTKFGYTAILTLFFYLIAVFGSVLLFIPSILACMVILLIPLFSDEENIGNALKKVWRVVKDENIFLFIDILIVLSVNLLIWSGSLYLISNFENNNLVYLTIRVLSNAIFFPFLYFYLTVKYRKDLGDDRGY